MISMKQEEENGKGRVGWGGEGCRQVRFYLLAHSQDNTLKEINKKRKKKKSLF